MNRMLFELNFSRPMEPGGFTSRENGQWLSLLLLPFPTTSSCPAEGVLWASGLSCRQAEACV